VIISSGFSEVGEIELERYIVSYAKRHGMRVLGPNIFGVYFSCSSLNATFAHGEIRPGNIAIITQSGALGIAMIGKTAVENMGLSAIVSLGNKADIDEADMLDFLVHDDNTQIIMMYMEGVQQGERLMEALKRVTRYKPVIIIKSGRSQRGAIAAASHTGSLAGSDDIFDAVMGQCGALRAESLQEAFDWCKVMACNPLPPGENTMIITNGGGIGVMATDACEKYGVNLYDNPVSTKQIFDDVTPAFGSTKNPVDITGQATSEHYDKALEAGAESEAIDSVLALYCETALFDGENLPDMVERNHRMYAKIGKPVVFALLGGSQVEKCLEKLRTRHVPVFDDVYRAVSCLGSMYEHQRHVKAPSALQDTADIDSNLITTIIDGVRADGRTFLLAHEAQEVMHAAGIPVPISHIARSLEEAVHHAESIGYPVVMKIMSKDIIHKSDAGGIALDLENRQEVMDAYEAIMYNARAYDSGAVIEGVEVCEMVSMGTETIVGARRDQTFGPVVMFGLGGIYVEVMKDVAFRSFPLSHEGVAQMVSDIRSFPLLMGVRGEEQKDIQGIMDAIIKVGTIIRACDDISDIEINPLNAYENGQGVKAVDVRILLSHIQEAAT